MKTAKRITCNYHPKKKGLPTWVAPYFIILVDFLFWLLLLITKVGNIAPLLILWNVGLIAITIHLLTLYLFSTHSPIKWLRWKKLLQLFSEYSSLIAEDKPTRWEISSDGEKDIIKFMPAGSISKSMSNIEIDVPEKLTQFLEVKTGKIWYITDTITERSSITMIFTHKELTRYEGNFEFKLSDELDLENFHIFLTGASGTGKTALTTLAILSTAREIADYPVPNAYRNLRVIDPKGASLYSLRYSVALDGAETFANTPEQALVLLQDFYEEITYRGKLLDSPHLDMNADYRTLNLPPCWLFFDEFVDLIEQAKIKDKQLANEIQSLLVRCVTKGRQLGCFLWITAMRADTAYLPGLVRSTMINIALATEGREIDAENARMMFGSAINLQRPPKNTKFYGYAKGESGKPKLFLTPKIGENTDVRHSLNYFLGG